MGLIIKNYQNEIGFKSDKYVKLDSVRAGMGENGKISCCCTEWANTLARSNNNQYIKANVYYHIPDSNIESASNLINAVYPLLKKYFTDLGYTVEDDTQNYEEILKNKKEEKQKQLLLKQQEEVNDGTE